MIGLVRGWTDVQRTAPANVRLGMLLAFVAGAVNAGGFLAVGRYTSHMTGVVSAVADDLVLGEFVLALAGVMALLAFLSGAMTTAWMVNWGLRHQLRSAYGLPLLVEAALLLVFGVFGSAISLFAGLFLPLTVVLLCYIMGLQNAVITKVSRAEIRTTHVTGLITDMGIELGKLLYINRLPGNERVTANRQKLGLHLRLVGCFFCGGVTGAMGFKWLGYVTTVPLAFALLLASTRPALQDLRAWLQRRTMP
jgi:uncharacterized membrane protein YoaK (UPF0700 family)